MVDGRFGQGRIGHLAKLLERGVGIGDAQLDELLQRGGKRLDAALLERLPDAEVVRAVADEHGLSLEQAAARLDRLMALFDPFDETVELIGELDEAGYGLYVLSNMPEEFMTYVERLDVLRHFDGLVISSRVHLAKPDPRIFALLGERYGVVPGQTLFVDDKPSNTEAAARLGFRTCTFRPDGAGCDAVRRQLGLVSGEEER